jgi:rhodanese-related sulfurtransferase
MKQTASTFIHALIVLVFSVSLAFVVNALRSDGIPPVMPFPPEYQCPSFVESGQPLSVKQALNLRALNPSSVIFVDARPPELFDAGHIEGAVSIPYSFLDPVSSKNVQKLKRYGNVIIYCNNRDAEMSGLMAGELSRQGLEGVVYLEGGFLEWVKQGGPYAGQRPEKYEEFPR